MILITVGTEKFQFNRLMQWVDRLITQGFLDPQKEEIVIQAGACAFVPQGAQSHQVLPADQFQALFQRARLIIAHCGEGTVDLLAGADKPFILVPRSKQFEEHVDDHQVELAESLARQNIPVAYTPGDLARFLLAPWTATISLSPKACYAQASRLLTTDIFQRRGSASRPAAPTAPVYSPS